jgi:hypothetical protein
LEDLSRIPPVPAAEIGADRIQNQRIRNPWHCRTVIAVGGLRLVTSLVPSISAVTPDLKRA